MTEQELRNKMHEGLMKVIPKTNAVTELIMDVYQEGFKCCWELLTGTKFDSDMENYETKK